MKALFNNSSNFIRLQTALAVILLTALLSAAQAVKTKKVSWKGLGDKKNKFFFQIPDGFRYFEDGTFYLGTKSDSVYIKNKQTVSRYINGAVLILDIYEGDTKKIQPALIEGSKFEPVEEKTGNGFQIKSYIYKSPDFIIERQHFFDDESLYSMSAFYRAERSGIVAEFFKSVRLFKDGKGTAPNFPKDGKKELLNAQVPDVEEEFFSDKIEENPDKKAVIAYVPIATWNREFGRSNKGNVKLKLLFAVTGKVEKIKTVFMPTVSMADGVKAAAENIVFLPAVKNGNPVSTWQPFEYGFNITTTGY